MNKPGEPQIEMSCILLDDTGLLEDCQLRFIQVLLEVLHEGCPACSHGRGVARVGLVLAVDVSVGITDVDLAKLGEEIDTGAIGSPEVGGTDLSIAHVTCEDWTALVIGGCFQSQ